MSADPGPGPRGRGTSGAPDVLEAVERHLRRLTWAGAVLWLGAGAALVLLAAWLLVGTDGWPLRSRAPLLLDGALLLGVVGGLAAIRRLGATWLRRARVAAAMDRAVGLPEGSVLGAAELARRVPPGVSRGLARTAERGLLPRLSGSPRRLSGRLGERTRGWVRKGGGAFSFLALGLLGLVLLSPGRSRAAWGGLLDPVGTLRGEAFGPLTVEPGDAQVLRGDPLEIRIRAPGRETVALAWRAAGDVARSRTLGVGPDGAQFTFSEVSTPLEYWVRAPDGETSPRFGVEPVDPLFLSGITVEATFPPHTGLPPQEHRGEIPALTIPVGTRLRIRGRASRTLAEASLLEAGGGGAVPLEVEGSRISASWRPRSGGRWEWHIRGLSNEDPRDVPPPLELTLVRDSAPEVDVTFPGVDTILPLGLRQHLVLEARDDYGIRRLELEAYRESPGGRRWEPVVRRLQSGGTRAAVARPVLDVSGWELLPGDVVRYRARAVDNAPSPGTATSRWYALRMPEREDLGREATERLDRAADTVEELARRADEAEGVSRELERAAAGPREGRGRDATDRNAPGERRESGAEEPLGFREREEVERALERQESLLERTDSLRRDLEELASSMRDAGAPDPDLRRDLTELRELLDEMATPELRERLRELTERLVEMDREEVRDRLGELAGDQEELRDRLETSLERFRRAAARQELRSTAREAEVLAQEQEILADALGEEREADLQARRQEALERRTRALVERTEALEERLAEIDEAEVGRRVEEAGQEARRAAASMQEASRSARSSQPSRARSEASRASEELSRAAESLRSGGAEMAEGSQEEVRQALRRTAEDALSLARRQAELGDDPRRDGPQEARSDLRADQAALLQGVRALAENLSGTSGLPPDAGRRLSEQMGKAMEEMSRLVREEVPQPGTVPSQASPASLAIQALNETALLAMAAGGQQGGPGQQSGSQGARSLLEQLEALARQQGSLASRSGSILPLELSPEALARRLRPLSGEQRSVGGSLEELARRQSEEGGQTLGDLEALAREARELARSLEGGRLDGGTLERQERLFHRLLDAGRSLEMDELSDRRESRSAGAVPPRNVPALTPEALGRLRFRLPDSDALRALTPAQRALVLEYFERLNRAAPPAGGGGGGGP